MAKNGQYVGVRKLFARYWIAYGGFKSIVGSPYMHASLFITLISSGIWLKYDWVEIPISVLPNIIGFSLGGYAIWLALGDDKFRASISGKTKDGGRSEEHTSELQSRPHLVCRLLLEKKKKKKCVEQLE